MTHWQYGFYLFGTETGKVNIKNKNTNFQRFDVVMKTVMYLSEYERNNPDFRNPNKKPVGRKTCISAGFIALLSGSFLAFRRRRLSATQR